jgi:hypothetical protein
MVVRKKVFSDTKFAAFNPDYVLPYIIYLDIQNQIIVKNDTFTCAVNIIIKLEGITAHAGEPERDQPCDGDSINYYQSILLFRLTFQRKLLPDYSIYTSMGKKPTVFCGSGEIHYGKKYSNAKMRTIETTLEHIAHEVADEYLKCDIKWTQGFQANENDEMQSISSKQQ